MNRIKPYLQLVRLPNLFTAAADSLAGWLIVRGTLDEPGRWLPLVLASVSIYAAGIVLNDVFDFEIDLTRAAQPAAAVGTSLAKASPPGWAGSSLALGPVAWRSLSGSTTSLIVALALAALRAGL